MRHNDMSVGQFDFEYGVRQRLNDRSFKFYNVVLRQNNPSFVIMCFYAFVKISTSSGSIATVFS